MKTLRAIGRCVRPLESMGLHEAIIVSNSISPRKQKREEAQFPMLIDELKGSDGSDFYTEMTTNDHKILAKLKAIHDIVSSNLEAVKAKSLNIEEWNISKASCAKNLVMLEFKNDGEAELFFEMYKNSKAPNAKK